MSAKIPRPALVLGLLGTLPFIAGALISLNPEAFSDLTTLPFFTAKLIGAGVLNAYGTVILAFMAGVLWGFATKAPAHLSMRYYVLSVIPAILVFFNALYSFAAPLIGYGQASLLPLLLGFVALLALDYLFTKAGLTPDWWMKLRIMITAIVVICLGTGQLAS